ncbi:XdhC family protein [Streptomyces camelliae]|uniref:XdhC family protein n=1 Tax=Streptomyces camelliae TaxID=3004093 RepID=A0ABY7PF44_9ACTN|nr:XdhC/CoxI family protein [Streptomyces sp. HUAS 2-6]WBO68790.1 XdhC family protein [Streptomyces sp. HUAS 2-6]
MRHLAPHLLEWQAAGAPYAIAGVVAVRGNAPLKPGAALCVRADGTALGSVPGSCVEGAVYDLAREVLASKQPRFVSFGYSDDDALTAGLTCGGEIDVFVQGVDEDLARVLAAAHLAAAARRPVVVARVMSGLDGQPGGAVAVWKEGHLGSTGSADLDLAVLADARLMLSEDVTAVRAYDIGAHGEPQVLFEAWSPQPRLLIFGADAHAAAVSQIGAFLGYHVTVCDARATFTTPERFPHAHEVVVDWPHRYLAGVATDRRTVVCVMTHDPKFDIPVLTEALGRPLAYVGALGSRRTQARRIRDLAEAGVSPEAMARLHAPVGLDLGASTPQETAVAFAAELIAVRSGRSLSLLDGPIHPTAGADRVGHTMARDRCTA